MASSTFHVLSMYANLLAEKVADTFTLSDLIAGADPSMPAFDGVATCDDSMTRWRLALINRDPEQNLSCKVLCAGQPLQGQYQATTLSGESPDAYNDIDQPDRVIPQRVQLEFQEGVGTLPPHSVTILEIDG